MIKLTDKKKLNQKPNILLIYTDQQRYDTIHDLGNSVIQTPNLDRLVKEGVAFTEATTPSPVCMPARWSLHTGQWTSTNKCYSNHHPGPEPSYSLPQILNKGGYRTSLIGKNHSFLEPADLDLWEENPEPEASKDYEKRQQWMKQVFDKKYLRLAEEPVPGGVETSPPHARTTTAMKFMDQCEEKPFFLWLSFLYLHTPYLVCEPYFSMYKDVDLPGPYVEEENLKAAGKPFRQQFHQWNND